MFKLLSFFNIYICFFIFWRLNLWTWSSSLVTLARPSTSSSLRITDRSFQYASPRLWNQLPAPLRKPRTNLSNSAKIQNPRWRTAAIVKTVKSPYLRNRLTDFDEIWHGDAHWPRTWDRPLKFRIFENLRWRNESSNLQPKVKRKYWYIKCSVLQYFTFTNSNARK